MAHFYMRDRKLTLSDTYPGGVTLAIPMIILQLRPDNTLDLKQGDSAIWVSDHFPAEDWFYIYRVSVIFSETLPHMVSVTLHIDDVPASGNASEIRAFMRENDEFRQLYDVIDFHDNNVTDEGR